MVKCAVSGCPNHMATGTQRVLDRPAKRFFSFPEDPAQAKVWLAALRETFMQDLTEQRFLCEDHFLPEDVSQDGVRHDAIPIMPPCQDGLLGPESSEEEEEEDPDPPQQFQNPAGCGGNRISADVRHMKQSIRAKSVPVGRLTQRLLKLLLVAPDGCLDLRQAIRSLQTRGHRVFNIINVLDEMNLVQKEPINRIRWIATTPISSFLWKNTDTFRREVEKMRLLEDALDTIIEGCARQLFVMTDEAENLASAYVTRDDIGRLEGLEEQTVIVIRAPEETKLEIPSPKEDNIQVRVKAVRGPITVLTSDLGSGSRQNSFVTLEESRIQTGSLGPQGADPGS